MSSASSTGESPTAQQTSSGAAATASLEQSVSSTLSGPDVSSTVAVSSPAVNSTTADTTSCLPTLSCTPTLCPKPGLRPQDAAGLGIGCTFLGAFAAFILLIAFKRRLRPARSAKTAHEAQPVSPPHREAQRIPEHDIVDQLGLPQPLPQSELAGDIQKLDSMIKNFVSNFIRIPEQYLSDHARGISYANPHVKGGQRLLTSGPSKEDSESSVLWSKIFDVTLMSSIAPMFKHCVAINLPCTQM